jgi:hypothetical protein
MSTRPPEGPALVVIDGRGSPSIQDLWSEFLAARDIAMQSRDIADGIRCGQAWGRFLRAFEGGL